MVAEAPPKICRSLAEIKVVVVVAVGAAAAAVVVVVVVVVVGGGLFFRSSIVRSCVCLFVLYLSFLRWCFSLCCCWWLS